MDTQTIDPNDSLVLFADLQQGIIDLTRTTALQRLKKAVGGLAKLARLFSLPIIVTAVAGEDGKAATITPEIEQGYGKYPVYYRTTANSLLNDEIIAAIRKSGRRTLLISGVATELAVQLPAVTAAEHGLRALIVLDACGGVSERTEQAALTRAAHAGATTVAVMTLAGEMAGDFRQPSAPAALAILFDMATA